MIFATSAPVTAWPERLALTAATVALVLIAAGLMRAGWRKRQAIQSEIVAPLEIPTNFQADVVVEGRYLASTAAGAWLSRITVHELGVPSRCTLSWGSAGFAFQRDGAASFFVPRADLVDMRADRAIAGRAFEKDGIAVLTWRLGEVFIDSGFRADNTAAHVQVLNALSKQESGA